MRLAADELGALLRAHAYVQVERPPTLWDFDTTGLEPFVRMLGEFLASGLVRNGGDLGALRLTVANVQVDPEASDPIPEGDHVAITVAGSGDWADGRWWPEKAGDLVGRDLTTAVSGAGAVYAYSRHLGADSGSVTALFRRSGPAPTRAP